MSPVGCCHASEAVDRERFEAGALCESGTREPRGRSEVDRVCRARRPANLKTCKQVRAKYFYEACPSATRADATGVKAPARHPSQCSDPRFRCSMGDVSSTIASSALPPGRLIARVLSACQKTPVFLESGMPNCRQTALSWLPITEGGRFSNRAS